MAKIQYYKDKKSEWRFRIVANNGRIVATGEGYTRLENAKKGIRAIETIMLNCGIEDIEEIFEK